ncbi:MAG: TetR/AcrR family transcriptional regulator [Proteobacteria bacterium]|nr:TetR/AcrR family transcriptional regulator [Pseudomonadota bacterium]
MKKGQQTKERMIAAAAELLRKRGYYGTGVSEIIRESGAPKGSLYFHFPGGKEELACVALAHAGDEWGQRLGAVVRAAPSLADAALAVCRTLADDLVNTEYVNGCPLATVALEAAHNSEPVRKVCEERYQAWEELIRDDLHERGKNPDDAAELATLVLSAVEGAALLTRVYRDRTPLERVGKQLQRLLAAPGAGGSGAGEPES